MATKFLGAREGLTSGEGIVTHLTKGTTTWWFDRPPFPAKNIASCSFAFPVAVGQQYLWLPFSAMGNVQFWHFVKLSVAGNGQGVKDQTFSTTDPGFKWFKRFKRFKKFQQGSGWVGFFGNYHVTKLRVYQAEQWSGQRNAVLPRRPGSPMPWSTISGSKPLRRRCSATCRDVRQWTDPVEPVECSRWSLGVLITSFWIQFSSFENRIFDIFGSDVMEFFMLLGLGCSWHRIVDDGRKHN